MCAQLDAPNVSNLINTCNGFYCEDFLAPHFQTRATPAAWTENWSGWYQLFRMFLIQQRINEKKQ